MAIVGCRPATKRRYTPRLGVASLLSDGARSAESEEHREVCARRRCGDGGQRRKVQRPSSARHWRQRGGTGSTGRGLQVVTSDVT